jgi:hypothetical protein
LFNLLALLNEVIQLPVMLWKGRVEGRRTRVMALMRRGVYHMTFFAARCIRMGLGRLVLVSQRLTMNRSGCSSLSTSLTGSRVGLSPTVTNRSSSKQWGESGTVWLSFKALLLKFTGFNFRVVDL